jgi:hypothetical protein
VVTIAATGQRFEKANLYPTHKPLQRGQPLSMTTGFKGGLSSRTGFVIASESELPDTQKDYLERVAKPYFAGVVTWLENIRIGMKGGEMYSLMESILPKEKYGWHLNPGHLSADEEWMSSPIYKHSTQTLKSGMILQIDIIPSVRAIPAPAPRRALRWRMSHSRTRSNALTLSYGQELKPVSVILRTCLRLN